MAKKADVIVATPVIPIAQLTTRSIGRGETLLARIRSADNPAKVKLATINGGGMWVASWVPRVLAFSGFISHTLSQPLLTAAMNDSGRREKRRSLGHSGAVSAVAGEREGPSAY